MAGSYGRQTPPSPPPQTVWGPVAPAPPLALESYHSFHLVHNHAMCTYVQLLEPCSTTAKVLETLEEVIKEVLWEERDKLLTDEAWLRLEDWVAAEVSTEGRTPVSEIGSTTARTRFEVNIADYFNQLAGTSTGGLLALYCESKRVRVLRVRAATCPVALVVYALLLVVPCLSRQSSLARQYLFVLDW